MPETFGDYISKFSQFGDYISKFGQIWTIAKLMIQIANLYMTKLINESSLFQHSFLIRYFNGNIFFFLHM